MKPAPLFLGFTGFVLVAVLALLWQAFGPRSGSPAKPEPLARTRPAPALRPTESEANGVRSVYPGAGTGTPRAPQQDGPREGTSATTATRQPEPPLSAGGDAPPKGRIEDEAKAEDASGTIDLNTATLDQLNGLGVGMVGKTIIANRPYTSPDDLIARRVLNRRDYETIKSHVVAR